MNKCIFIIGSEESANYDAVYNNIPDKTIQSHIFGWFYIARR